MENKAQRHSLRLIIDDILREKFIEQNTLLHELRGEILELEYKGDPQVIQDLLDNLQTEIDSLKTDNLFKQTEIDQLKLDKQNLDDQITSINIIPNNHQTRIEDLENKILDLLNRIDILENPEL